ncbi:MAG: septum formation family protein [Actinomycetota bacterium]|nr:septum formation family protein [Actinomycetota bacterium]
MYVGRLKTPAAKVAAGLSLGVLVLVAGCTPAAKQAASSDPTSGATSSGPTKKKPSPLPSFLPTPDADTCRELRFVDIGRYSNATPTTSCAGRHTGFTFEVTRLPPDIAFEGVQIKNDAIQQQAGQACRDAFETYVGGDAAARARVRLTVTYFLPDQDTFDAGARWVRCDIIALQADQILADLPMELEGLLDDDAAVDDYGLCSTGQPGAIDSKQVTCDQPHTYRAIAALRLGAMADSYPGETETRVVGKQRCEDLIVDLLGSDGGFTHSWTFPTPEDWNAGQRFGYCWNKASD